MKNVKLVRCTAALISVITCSGLYQTAHLSTMVSAANPTSVAVSCPSKVNPGMAFVVSIIVTPGTSIAGLQFDLTYTNSSAGLSNPVTPVLEGTWLSQGGTNTTYFLGGTPGSGIISGVTGVITSAGKSVSTPGTFATIGFTASEVGGPCAFSVSNVVVGDSSGQSVPVVTVNAQTSVNRVPVLGSIGNKSITEGTSLQFILSGTDADGDTLSYTALNLPQGATFNTSTRTFSWTPNYVQAGVYDNIIFKVTDGSLTAQEVVKITVTQPFPDWDINGDGSTNTLDMIRVGQVWGSTGAVGWAKEDVNHDCVVNVLDMILVGQHWG